MGTILYAGTTYYIPKSVDEVIAVLSTNKWLKLDRNSAVIRDRGAQTMYVNKIIMPRYIRTDQIQNLTEADPLDVSVCERALKEGTGYTHVNVKQGLQELLED